MSKGEYDNNSLDFTAQPANSDWQLYPTYTENQTPKSLGFSAIMIGEIVWSSETTTRLSP